MTRTRSAAVKKTRAPVKKANCGKKKRKPGSGAPLGNTNGKGNKGQQGHRGGQSEEQKKLFKQVSFYWLRAGFFRLVPSLSALERAFPLGGSPDSLRICIGNV